MTGKSSNRWLREHFSDPYVKKAQSEGVRSRAIYKLQEIDQRDKLFKPGMRIVDLGAAPGSWSEYVSNKVKPSGIVIAMDLLPIADLENVKIIQGDFTDDDVLAQLIVLLENKFVDWVLSDMAPNMSGNDSVDIPKSLYLVELALDFAINHLQPQGGIVFKIFQGSGSDEMLHNIRATFSTMQIRKPKASRGRSREIYVVAQTLK